MTRAILCPRDQLPLPKQRLVQEISFPEDAANILDLVLGRFNVVIHQVCHEPISLQPPTLVINTASNSLAVCGMSDDELEDSIETAIAARADTGSALEEVRARVATFASYAELAVVVRGWLSEYLLRATAPIFSSPDDPPAGPDGRRSYQHPLVLLALNAQVDGRLPVDLRSDPALSEEEQRDYIRDLLGLIVANYINELQDLAIDSGDIARLIALLEERIPPECITESGLDRLVHNCGDWDGVSPEARDLGQVFRCEYINAVAHAAAGVENPRESTWAATVVGLFHGTRTEAEASALALLVSSAALQRTLSFERAWNAVVRYVGLTKPENLQWAFEFFDHLGMRKRFDENMRSGAEWMAIDPGDTRSDDELVRGVVEAMDSSLAGHGWDRDCPELRTRLVSNFVRMFLDSGRPAAARAYMEAELDRSAQAGEYEYLCHTILHCVQLFNARRHHDDSGAIVARYLPVLNPRAGELPCSLYVGLLIELGNSLRYLHRPRSALRTYDIAAELGSVCNELDASSLWVLQKNRAIALREIGRFHEAIQILEQLFAPIETEPSQERVDICLSLAVTYLAANLPAQALKFAELACSLRLTRHAAPVRINALIARATARARLEPTAPVEGLEEALHLAEHQGPLLAQVASAALGLDRQGCVPEPVIARSVSVIKNLFDAWDQLHVSDVLATAAAALGEWYFHHGQPDSARAVVDRLVTAGGEHVSWPWQLLQLRARLLPASESQTRWKLLNAALDRVEAEVPDESGVAFTTPWMADKSEFQADLLESTSSAVRHGIAASVDAVRVFEFMNGREMQAGGPRDGNRPPAADILLSQIAESTPERFPARAFLFLEGTEAIDVVVCSLTDPQPRLLSHQLDARAARSVATQFLARIPRLLTSQAALAETILAPLLQSLGNLLAEASQPGEHVVLLPSPALLGLPLHAATMADESLLLERNTVSVVPNLATLNRVLLSNRPLLGPQGTQALFAVTLVGEEDRYVERTSNSADSIVQHLGLERTSDVRELDVTRETCLDLLSRVDHAVILCHGADAGLLRGRGICVSDGKQRPPALLPVEQDPDLRRFIVDAVDIERLDSVPAFVASIACSSGRSTAGPGGTRIGLERSLFANGTRTILAPLWDVKQQSALTFLSQFYSTWQEHETWTLAQIHQQVCIEMRREYHDLFRWGPFALNGYWLKG
jgi:tetratricopeptide (TPR) repeat protein